MQLLSPNNKIHTRHTGNFVPSSLNMFPRWPLDRWNSRKSSPSLNLHWCSVSCDSTQVKQGKTFSGLFQHRLVNACIILNTVDQSINSLLSNKVKLSHPCGAKWQWHEEILFRRIRSQWAETSSRPRLCFGWLRWKGKPKKMKRQTQN